MIDSHCHLDLDAFNDDRAQIIQQAISCGVSRIHIPGTEAYRWKELLSLAESAFIDISLGLHPYFLANYQVDSLNAQLQSLEGLLDSHTSQVFAVGECGLDAVIDVDFGLQTEIFKRHIQLASTFSKPLIVHARKSHHHIIQCLKQCRFEGGGIIHAFNGSAEVAEQYTQRGWKLGIGGTITYPRGQKTRQTLIKVGLEHLVLETDSPDMPLFGFQGRRNVPARLPQIASVLAETLSVSVQEVVETTSENYLSLAQ